jgi:hypothetical protein
VPTHWHLVEFVDPKPWTLNPTNFLFPQLVTLCFKQGPKKCELLNTNGHWVWWKKLLVMFVQNFWMCFFGPPNFGTRNHLHTMKWKEGRSLDLKVLILVHVFCEIERDG